MLWIYVKAQIISVSIALAIEFFFMVYKKYGFEEEDFMKNINDEIIMKNQDFQTIFKDMEISIIKLMQYLGMVTPEDSNIFEQNIRNSQIKPKGPVVMPGMPVIRWLQMQQMQLDQQQNTKK